MVFLFAAMCPALAQNDTLPAKSQTEAIAPDSLAALRPVLSPSRDTLVLRNNARIAAKILEIGPETVRYKRADNEDGPTYTTYKSEIRYILLKSGTKEIMDTLARPQSAAAVKNPADAIGLYRKGTADAKVFYTRHSGEIGVGIASLFTGIIGIIPAIIVSAVAPREKNLGYPNYELWKQKDYQAGYKRQAKRIKQKKVWAGFGIGFGSSLIIVALLNR